MKIFLTDSLISYNRHITSSKILFNGLSIIMSDILTCTQMDELNNNFNLQEMVVWDKINKITYASISLLKEKRLTKNDILSKRPANLHNIAYLLPLIQKTNKDIITLDLFLTQLFSNLLFSSFHEVELILSDKFNNKELLNNTRSHFPNLIFSYQIQSTTLFSKIKTISNYFIKNSYYTLHALQNNSQLLQPTTNKITTILLVIYDIKHHKDVLSVFFSLVKKNLNIHLKLLIYEVDFISAENKALFSDLVSENISVFYFRNFKTSFWNAIPNTFRIYKYFNGKLSLFTIFKSTTATEQNYRWMQRALIKLQPDICLHMSTHDTGRYMADVSHSLNIPSVHVDYALFSDNPLMDRGIKYSTRLPISPAITSIWKKQNDPTPNHIPIGFLKFDKIPISGIIKRDFFEENKLNINEPTLFFASTWSEAGTSYESEKRQIIENLVTLCKHKNWNLIIKKHPLEFDTIADTIINEKGNSKQVVFNHASLSLFDAITFSDITINQMSSVVLECLYLNKPFCYISLSTEKKMFENSIFREENFAKKFSSLNELNDFLSSFFSNVSIQNSIKKEMENKKEYYLTKTDGLASQRLLNLLVLMAEENKKLNLQPQEDLYQLKT